MTDQVAREFFALVRRVQPLLSCPDGKRMTVWSALDEYRDTVPAKTFTTHTVAGLRGYLHALKDLGCLWPQHWSDLDFELECLYLRLTDLQTSDCH